MLVIFGLGTALIHLVSTTTSARSTLLSTKRHRGHLEPVNTPLLKKIRMSSGRSSPRSTLSNASLYFTILLSLTLLAVAQRVINKMKSKGKVKLCLPTKKSKLPLEMRLHSCELHTPAPQRLPSVVIDLTMNSESEGEAAPSNATPVSTPNFEPHALSQQHPSSVGEFWLYKPLLSSYLNYISLSLVSSRNLIPLLYLSKIRTNALFFIGPRSKVPHLRQFHTRLRSHSHRSPRLLPLHLLAVQPPLTPRPPLSSLGDRDSLYHLNRIAYMFPPARLGTRSSLKTEWVVACYFFFSYLMRLLITV